MNFSAKISENIFFCYVQKDNLDFNAINEIGRLFFCSKFLCLFLEIYVMQNNIMRGGVYAAKQDPLADTPPDAPRGLSGSVQGPITLMGPPSHAWRGRQGGKVGG